MKGMKVLCRAGALALLFAASGASAQEEGVAMKSILGSIGIIPKEKPPIVYNERAPLVLPPKMDLRPPVPAAPEARNANWPKDPDVMAARKAAQDAKAPYTETEVYKLGKGRLSIEEMRAGRDPNNYVSAAPANPKQSDKTVMSPDELRALSRNNDEKQKLAGDGLERRYLSDPPAPLLKSANGGPLKATADEKPFGDPDSPYAFFKRQ